jgi:hypothetical protein
MGDARLNPGSVSFSLILRTRRLLPNTYPDAQLPLSDRVLALRDGQGMSFKAIAEMLALEGWKGARGAGMSAKGVFSVYKKRNAHEVSRSAPVLYWITDIVAGPVRRSRAGTAAANVAVCQLV